MNQIKSVLTGKPNTPSINISPADPLTNGKPSTDLINYSFPDSTNILIERYKKYLKLIKTIQGITNGYNSMAIASIKQYDLMNNKMSTKFPDFESNNNNTTVSGSKTLNLPTSTTNPSNDIDNSDILSIDTNIDSNIDPNNIKIENADFNMFLSLLRQNLSNQYSKSINFKSNIENQILPDLNNLINEVLKNQKDFINKTTSIHKDLDKAKENSIKSLKNLDNSVQEFDIGHFNNSRNNHIDYKKDPYFVKRSLSNDASLQILAENSTIEFIATSETSLHSFESKILTELKRIFANLTNYIQEDFSGNSNDFINLNNVLINITDNSEWNNFITKNSKYLITSSIDNNGNLNNDNLTKTLSNLSIDSNKNLNCISKNPYKRSIENITFQNDNHLSTMPKLEGTLSRQESKLGLNKSYKNFYFVITTAGFFYQFPSREFDNNHPILVLYIPDCETKNMGNDTKHGFRFSLRGKDLSSLTIKKNTYIFKASSADDFNTWWSAISQSGGSVQVDDN